MDKVTQIKKNDALFGSIPDGIIKKIYLESIDFLYLENINEINNIRSSLFDYLNKFKFLTYHIIKQKDPFFQFPFSNEDKIPQNTLINSVICMEKQCLIIKNIDENLITNLINDLKQQSISIIKYDSRFNYSGEKPEQQEVYNFCNLDNHYKIILYNKLVKYTITSVIGFFIRRFFYPTNYFQYKFSIDSDESDLQNKILNLYKIDINDKMENNAQKLEDVKKKSTNEKSSFKKKEFKSDDFIELRQLYGNSKAKLILVFHLETMNIFMMKKIEKQSSDKNNHKNELFFNSNYSNRSIMPFYGFLNNNEGFIYKFMANDSLDKFIINNPEKINDIYFLLIITRLAEALDYLSSNNLVHRDIKPSNILIDNNYLPYIGDLESVRKLKSNNEEEDNIYTVDQGTQFYTAPELDKGIVTCACDIYSFGRIIEDFYKKENETIRISCSKNIDYLLDCVKENPEDRPNIINIKKYIEKEIINICTKREKKLTDIEIYQMSQLINEFILYYNIRNLHSFFDDIFCNILFSKSSERDYLKIGKYFEDGNYVTQDYEKAKYYYQLSANNNNPDAIAYLGFLYYNGYGCDIDYYRAKNYFQKSLKLDRNNQNANLGLGNIYFDGCGVKQNYVEAKKFYEISIKQNNQYAFVKLGIMYENGLGVIQDFQKAKEFYEKAAQQNNPEAFLMLGNIYLIGKCGVKDSNLAFNCYFIAAQYKNVDAANILLNLGLCDGNILSNIINNENVCFYNNMGIIKNDSYDSYDGYPSSDQHVSNKHTELIYVNRGILTYDGIETTNNSNWLLLLGNFYYINLLIDQHYLKAKIIYEIAAVMNNSYAILYLGLLYENGYGINKNCLKAIELYEKSAKLGNSYAYLFLGKLYLYGNGIEQNYYRARICFEKAAQLNNANALVFLGNIYFHGYSVDKNYKIARQFYELAERANNKYTLLILGYIYYYGYGVNNVDYSKALNYFKRSKKMNNPDAVLALGKLYELGHGVQQNYSKAKKYYEKLLPKDDINNYMNDLCDDEFDDFPYNDINEEHHKMVYTNIFDFSRDSSDQTKSEAYLCIGKLYEYGKGVTKNYERAINYYKKSANYENSNAFLKLAQIYEEGSKVKKDINLALFYYNLAANENNSFAMVNLGRIYQKGIEVEQDYKKALDYYESASK